jgi:hypothetical protein
MEHRWGQRVAVNIPVRLMSHPHGVGEGRIVDISLSGARIQTQLKLPSLSLVTVAIEPSDAMNDHWCHGPDTRLYACVVRRAVHEIGVEWTPVTSGEAIALLRTAFPHGSQAAHTP